MTGPAAPRERFAALIGARTETSLSPAMYRAAFAAVDVDWSYRAVDTTAGALHSTLSALRAAGGVGANITMPHKVAAVDVVDTIDATARRVGAVNCVTFGPDGAVGTNTDASGFAAALHAAGVATTGRRVVVVGAGGAARAVIVALDGADISVISRTPDAAGRLADTLGMVLRAGQVSDIVDADVVVNTTPVGMIGGPDPTRSPVPEAVLHDELTVVDLVTAPAATVLLRTAARYGARTVDGIGMLAHQGVAALHQGGLDVGVDVLEQAARRAAR
jgi:shikimate dehydrogenase